MKFFRILFNAQLKLQVLLYKKRELLFTLEKSAEIVTFFSMLLMCLKPELFIFSSAFLVMMIYLFSGLSIINNTLTSLRKFLLYGIILVFLLSPLLSFMLIYLLSLSSVNNSNIQLFVFITVPVGIWFFLSLIANNKVSKLVNLILATLLGIIVYVKDIVFNILPDNLFLSYKIAPEILGYSNKQVLEIFSDIILTPFLITNILTTLLCEIKSYWIEKYNNGEDITIELIKSKAEE